MPLASTPAQLLWHTLRTGSVHHASTRIATRLGQRPVRELTTTLREGATRRISTPALGPMGQFADGCIHLNDAARPLGLPSGVPLADWQNLLPWLPSQAAHRLGHVPEGLLDGLFWQATDVDWTYGEGPCVAGPAEALALAMTGRAVALLDLTGPGVPVLTGRLGA